MSLCSFWPTRTCNSCSYSLLSLLLLVSFFLMASFFPAQFSLWFVIDSLPFVCSSTVLYVLFLLSLINIFFRILFMSVMRSIKITLLIILFIVSLTGNLSLMDELIVLVFLCGCKIARVFLKVSVFIKMKKPPLDTPFLQVSNVLL